MVNNVHCQDHRSGPVNFGTARGTSQPARERMVAESTATPTLPAMDPVDHGAGASAASRTPNHPGAAEHPKTGDSGSHHSPGPGRSSHHCRPPGSPTARPASPSSSSPTTPSAFWLDNHDERFATGLDVLIDGLKPGRRPARRAADAHGHNRPRLPHGVTIDPAQFDQAASQSRRTRSAGLAVQPAERQEEHDRL